MAQMKIGWDSEITNYNSGTFLEFPVNPRLADMSMDSQRNIKEIPYSRFHLLMDKGGLKPKSVVLNGYFYGSNKNTLINTLNKYIYGRDSNNSGLLRFYYTSNKFFYCFGQGMKQTMVGERTNFTDYVVNLVSPIPFIYSDTLKSASMTISDDSTHDFKTSTTTGDDFKNDGSAPSHILEYMITNSSGGTITKVEISDESGLEGNKITWEGDLLNGKVLKIYLFKVVDDIFKKLYYTNDGVFDGDRDFDGKEPPFIPAETTNPVFSVKLTGNAGNTTVNMKWRDAYWW